jgi:hypothetical protein
MEESHFTENKHYWGISVGERLHSIHSPGSENFTATDPRDFLKGFDVFFFSQKIKLFCFELCSNVMEFWCYNDAFS